MFWFQAKLPTAEIAATINEFRTRHLSELSEVHEKQSQAVLLYYIIFMAFLQFVNLSVHVAQLLCIVGWSTLF